MRDHPQRCVECCEWIALGESSFHCPECSAGPMHEWCWAGHEYECEGIEEVIIESQT